MEGNTILNPNPLVKFLNKPQKEFNQSGYYSICDEKRY